MLNNSGLIILDEPTSAIYKLSATNLIKHLKSIKKDKIIILITHDDNLIIACDKVIDLDKSSLKCLNNS